jgi:hypothetical protein
MRFKDKITPAYLIGKPPQMQKSTSSNLKCYVREDTLECPLCGILQDIIIELP